MIPFACPACGAPLKPHGDGAGRMTSCPRCGRPVSSPSPAAATPPAGSVPAACLRCGVRWIVPVEGLAGSVKCPKCRKGYAVVVEEAPTTGSRAGRTSPGSPDPGEARTPGGPPSCAHGFLRSQLAGTVALL